MTAVGGDRFRGLARRRTLGSGVATSCRHIRGRPTPRACSTDGWSPSRYPLSMARIGWVLGCAAAFRGPLDGRIGRQLQLRGIGLDRFYTYKALSALAGFALPTLVGVVLLLTSGDSLIFPLIVAVLLGLIGFFLPDITVIGRRAVATASDATEALLTFFDLGVTLERLANSSATQSLHAAAAVSDQAVFMEVLKR